MKVLNRFKKGGFLTLLPSGECHTWDLYWHRSEDGDAGMDSGLQPCHTVRLCDAALFAAPLRWKHHQHASLSQCLCCIWLRHPSSHWRRLCLQPPCCWSLFGTSMVSQGGKVWHWHFHDYHGVEARILDGRSGVATENPQSQLAQNQEDDGRGGWRSSDPVGLWDLSLHGGNPRSPTDSLAEWSHRGHPWAWGRNLRALMQLKTSLETWLEISSDGKVSDDIW